MPVFLGTELDVISLSACRYMFYKQGMDRVNHLCLWTEEGLVTLPIALATGLPRMPLFIVPLPVQALQGANYEGVSVMITC